MYYVLRYMYYMTINMDCVVDQKVETMMEFTVENGKVGWKGSENNRARGKLSFSPPFLRACVQ